MRDDKGEIYTVRFDAVNAMLLNKFLKKQDSKIHKDNAQIEMSKSSSIRKL